MGNVQPNDVTTVPAQNVNGWVHDPNLINPLPGSEVVATPIRNYRRRRFIYSAAEKARAVQLLNARVPCRNVARMLGPHCSSATPIRWRQQARRQAETRRRLEEMMRARRRRRR